MMMKKMMKYKYTKDLLTDVYTFKTYADVHIIISQRKYTDIDQPPPVVTEAGDGPTCI